MAVNHCYRLAPWADVVYGCDRQYWEDNAAAIRKACGGEFWTISAAAAKVHGLNLIGSEKCNGISKVPNTIAEGGNSGYQAIGLALHFGASKVILLGFDMKQTAGRKHWHEDHKHNNPTREAFANWNKRFRVLASQSQIPIVNATRDTALDCFDRVSLDVALNGE